ncbi:MAG: orotidine 5'-phosphate decarboxylase / HUMPS family protein [Pyrobaculum sp.]
MKLQVALDLIDLRKAMELTRELCSAGLELIEVGTPLIKTYGLSAVSVIKTSCPTAEVLADLKTADVGRLEARLAKEFGADWGTVLGATNIETIEEFVSEGRAVGLKTAVDLIGVYNIVERVREIKNRISPDLFVLHMGIDVQLKTGKTFIELLQMAQRLREEGVGVAIAGGITDREVKYLVENKIYVDVVVIGRYIVSDESPKSKFIMINNLLKYL